jgi:3',5'-cyclic AMP phosphodiesterase CpdA
MSQPIEPPVDVLTLSIPGATRAFTFVHWTDVHLCACDERNAETAPYMKQRIERWGCDPDAVALATPARIRAIQPDFVAITGDLVDEPTEAALESGAALIRSLGVRTFVTLGNHEFGDKARTLDRDPWRRKLAGWADHALDFHTADFAGVTLIFVDNSDYQVTPDQLRRTQAALDTGRPCLLFCHIPWYLPTLVPATIAKWREPILACTQGMPEPRRLAWGMGPRNEPSTEAFLNLLLTRDTLRAAFAGHLHLAHTDTFAPTRPQYVTPSGFANQFRTVHIKPA